MKLLCRCLDKITAIAFRENWMVGIIDAPIASCLDWKELPQVHWLGPRSNSRYLADPFAWPGRDDLLLCEEYDLNTRIGRLKTVTIRDGGIVGEEPVILPLGGHLSYPFLFAHEGEVYCLPESAAARRLVLFRWQEGGWQEHAVALPDTAAADSILFMHDDLFWIAYTDIDKGPFDNLNLSYATSLKGPWTVHPGNPVRTGLTHARCGGTPFRANGKLYRPAQDCSKTYGGSLRIMEIVECTQTSYREEEACHIKPAAGMNPHGLHTLSAFGNKCLIDGKRLEFSFAMIARKALRRLRGYSFR